MIAIGVLAAAGLGLGAWFLFASREIKVWVYTDYAFRYNHQNSSPPGGSPLSGSNRIYQRNGTGVRWKVLDSSQIDPTSNVPTIDARRANMALHFDRQTDIFLILTGVKQGERTGSANPFTRVAVVVDFPDKSEAVNSRLLAGELTHLFGATYGPSDAKGLLADQPPEMKFSAPTVAVIHKMRGYPFELGIDGLSDGSWEKKAITALSQDTGTPGNAVAHAHLVLGTTLLNERHMSPALAHFRTAVEADRKSELNRLDLAEAYTRDTQYDKALTEAREAVRLAPNDALAPPRVGRAARPQRPAGSCAAGIAHNADKLEPTNPQNKVLIGYEYAVMFGHTVDDAVTARWRKRRE